MKKFVVGMFAGAILATTASVYADEGLEKVEAYLRPSLPITLNGQAVTLESSPVMYDGSTYLKLRDVASLTGLVVNWNDATQTVELGTNGGKSVSNETTQTKTQEEIDAALKKAARIVEIPNLVENLVAERSTISTSLYEYENNTSSKGMKPKDDFYYEHRKLYDEKGVLIGALRAELSQLTGQSQ